ncbi:hypothetical protein ACWEOH_02405 [Agromyces sp. NPDC004153]
MSRPRRHDFDSDADFYLGALHWLGTKWPGHENTAKRAAKWVELAQQAQHDRLADLLVRDPLTEAEWAEMDALMAAYRHRCRISRTNDTNATKKGKKR